jgi:hypothetical protein
MLEELHYSCLHNRHKGLAKGMGTINNQDALAKTMEESDA